MGSKSFASAALFFAFNLLFLSLVTATYCPPPPKPKPKPACPPPPKTPSVPTPSTPSSKGSCPRDTLKLGVCAKLLGGAIGGVVGLPSKTPCCSLLQGLTDLDAALCLCTAIKANVLGLKLNVPVSISLLLNTCGYKVPSGYKCA